MFETSEAEEVLGANPAALDDETLTEQLLAAIALMDRAQAAALAALGEWDARDIWARFGALSPGQWLHHRAPLSGRDARRLARDARSLRAAAAVAAAVDDAALTVAQGIALAGVRTPRTQDLFDAHQTELVDAATRLCVDDTIRLANRWLLNADTDGAPPDDDDQTARLSTGYQGRVRLDANLNADDGQMFRSVVEQIMDDLHQAAAAAGETPGRVGRRRADALVEMARRASAATDDQTAARPLIVIRADLSDLSDLAHAARPTPPSGDDAEPADDAAEPADATSAPGADGARPNSAARSGGASTADGAPLSWPALRQMLCDADLCPVITNGPYEILDVGRTARTATTAQRRALLIRDGGCVFPGCDRPPGWCQAHHIIWWEHDGPTNLENLCLLCNRHHHDIHRGRFHLQRRPDTTLEFTRPDGTVLQKTQNPDHSSAAI